MPGRAAPRAGWALAVLFLINTLNFFDRQILGAVVEPIRKEWGLSDREIGWISTAFTLLYAAVGLPLGRWADTGRRRVLLAAGVFFWSVMTVLSALATGFATLFAARLGVGVGEAACAPAATSLIGDLFPAERRGRATALFMLGLPVGLGLSYAVSGSVAQAFGWRAAFLVAGLPGLAIAALCLTLPEPVRGSADRVTATPRPGSPYRLLLGTPTLRFIIVSGALHNFNMYALATFLPAFLTRYHGLSVRQAGVLSGLVFGVVGGLGMIAGGFLGDRAASRRPDGRMRVSAAALAASVPLLLVALAQPPGHVVVALGGLALGAFCLYLYYAPVYATIHDVVAPGLRGTAMAVYFLAMYFLGASVGPVGTGALSDYLARRTAARAGSSIVGEASRAAGLHQAIYVIPALCIPLAFVLLCGARTVARDQERLR